MVILSIVKTQFHIIIAIITVIIIIFIFFFSFCIIIFKSTEQIINMLSIGNFFDMWFDSFQRFESFPEKI